jgi:hypothetical protein
MPRKLHAILKPARLAERKRRLQNSQGHPRRRQIRLSARRRRPPSLMPAHNIKPGKATDTPRAITPHNPGRVGRIYPKRGGLETPKRALRVRLVNLNQLAAQSACRSSHHTRPAEAQKKPEPQTIAANTAKIFPRPDTQINSPSAGENQLQSLAAAQPNTKQSRHPNDAAASTQDNRSSMPP